VHSFIAKKFSAAILSVTEVVVTDFGKKQKICSYYSCNDKIPIVGVESVLGPLGMSGPEWPIRLAPGDCDDGEFGGMKIGRGNRSTRRKPEPAPLCPQQIPLDQTRARTRAAAVGSQRLTA
jgi:hypothetical protein